MVQPLWKLVQWFLNKLNKELPYVYAAWAAITKYCGLGDLADIDFS